jgi:hypothetical protein
VSLSEGFLRGLADRRILALRRALKTLGYNDTYHGFASTLENARDCEMWLDALKAKYDGKGKLFGKEEFDQLLGHCQVILDRYSEMKTYPNGREGVVSFKHGETAN